jgi:hypothetical protein
LVKRGILKVKRIFLSDMLEEVNFIQKLKTCKSFIKKKYLLDIQTLKEMDLCFLMDVVG